MGRQATRHGGSLEPGNGGAWSQGWGAPSQEWGKAGSREGGAVGELQARYGWSLEAGIGGSPCGSLALGMEGAGLEPGIVPEARMGGAHVGAWRRGACSQAWGVQWWEEREPVWEPGARIAWLEPGMGGARIAWLEPGLHGWSQGLGPVGEGLCRVWEPGGAWSQEWGEPPCLWEAGVGRAWNQEP